MLVFPPPGTWPMLHDALQCYVTHAGWLWCIRSSSQPCLRNTWTQLSFRSSWCTTLSRTLLRSSQALTGSNSVRLHPRNLAWRAASCNTAHAQTSGLSHCNVVLIRQAMQHLLEWQLQGVSNGLHEKDKVRQPDSIAFDYCRACLGADLRVFSLVQKFIILLSFQPCPCLLRNSCFED